jgi:SAM-dependent methyltransferase
MAFLRRTKTTPLAVSMAGVEMGHQLLIVGCADRALLIDLASRVGLSGRACAIVPDETEAARATDAAARGGILVEVEIARGAFPFDSGAFDVAVIDNTADLLSASRPETRVGFLQETRRVLRAGGRIVVVEPGPRGGLLGAISRSRADPHFTSSGGTETALQAEAFAGVRVLAERDGRRFVEGTKRRE